MDMDVQRPHFVPHLNLASSLVPAPHLLRCSYDLPSDYNAKILPPTCYVAVTTRLVTTTPRSWPPLVMLQLRPA